MAEQLANRASTFLAEAMDDSQTSLKVTGAIGFPATPEFRIRINNELMIVTAGGSSTVDWTITRGAEGTVATDHPINARVYGVLTKGALETFIAENGGGGGGGGGSGIIESALYADLPAAADVDAGVTYLISDETKLVRSDGSEWQSYGPLYRSQEYNLPSAFSNLDSGGDNDSYFYRFRGSQYFYGGGQGDVDKLRMRATPRTFPSDWDITLALLPMFAPDANKQEFGLFIRTISSGKITTVGLRHEAGFVYGTYDTWTAFNTKDGSTAAVGKKIGYHGGPIWLRINQDFLGTTRRAWYSVDGQFWVLLTSQSSSFHSPDQYGIFLNPRNVSTTSGMKVLSLSAGVESDFELPYDPFEPSYQ